MARRRGRDRVLGGAATGGSLLYDPNVSLPRSSYRDSEGDLLYGRPEQAVYRDGRQTGRMPAFVSIPFPAKHRSEPLAAIRRLRLYSPTWRVELNRLPSRVRFCLQRKTRREVLFAKGRAGYSGSVKKRWFRRNANSNYGC